ncbi:DUF732 domain-containing protein [Mycobacterium sp. E136]|uniref:DUF732 domain-containing protein n=1 Tax=Mycobacterium sp. E136 TaxID=1834125 RepID=UPI0007FF6537|nr:DUF732 domain-containing protein [Mycobacterium sp. E136]OBG98751.1 DUF732 domain-containing protein [Mycobacterium sp. E136]
MQRSVRTTAAGSLLIASATALLTGCSGHDVMAAMGLPTSEAAPAPGAPGETTPGPPSATGHSNTLVLTDRQQGYLDALAAAGVTRSSDLLALRIGSYVCQARAAKHDDQKVWDSVYPLVRGDVRDQISGMAPTVDVDAATADYIRIASERLC